MSANQPTHIDMDSGVQKSLVFDALGPMRLREFVTVRIPGRLVWFNFDLARSLGLDVPATNSDNSKLNQQIIDMLSVRALRSGEGLGNRERVLLYADKYGGEDLGRCLGAGRAGFLATQNLYLKGIGHTPLFRHDDPADFEHSHGGVSMLEGMLEAVFGEVNTSLFTKGSARILALIDNDDYTIYPNGKKEPRAIVVRAGAQLRPAHLFAKGVQGGYSKLEVFTRITRLSGQLRTQKDAEPGNPIPDLTQTMLQVIDDHALVAAEQFRWRIMHGAMSMSNMEMSGAMIDSTTESSQPRTAPLRVLTQHPGAYLVFGQEHLERARHLKIMYRSLVKNISQRERELFNVRPIDFTAAMNRSYDKYLEIQFLKAAGLTSLVAQTLQSTRPGTVHRFRQILSAMAALRNRGSVNANNPPVEHISVLDVFNLLGAYPRVYFADPGRNHERQILTMLRPAFKGNRFHRAKQKANVRVMIQQFAEAYAQVMDVSTAADHPSAASMRASIVSRAAYENRPLKALYRGNLLKDLAKTIELYKAGGYRTAIAKTLARIISKSHRNLDGRALQGAKPSSSSNLHIPVPSARRS